MNSWWKYKKRGTYYAVNPKHCTLCIRTRLNFVLIPFATSISSSTTFLSYSAYYSTNHSSEYNYI